MGKKIAIIVVALVVVIAGVVFIPAVVNKCDNCGETIIGTGYYSLGGDFWNKVGDGAKDGKLTLDSADKNSTVCEACFNEQSEKNNLFGMIEINIEDFKRPLF